jgi:hypothetical protein
MATWEITITRRDGSRLRVTEQRGDPPQKGEIFEVDVGQILKARIDAYREERPGGSRPPFFQVTATRNLMSAAVTPRRLPPNATK